MEHERVGGAGQDFQPLGFEGFAGVTAGERDRLAVDGDAEGVWRDRLGQGDLRVDACTARNGVQCGDRGGNGGFLSGRAGEDQRSAIDGDVRPGFCGRIERRLCAGRQIGGDRRTGLRDGEDGADGNGEDARDEPQKRSGHAAPDFPPRLLR